MGTAVAHVGILSERRDILARRTKRLLNSIRKKEDISWNLLALHTPLKNWKGPVPA